MKNVFPRKVLLLLSGLSAWTAVVLLNGFAVEHISMLFIFILLAETVKESIFPYLLGLSLISILSHSLIVWTVLVAGLLSLFFSTSSRTRYIAFFAIAIALWFSSLVKLIPLVLLALASVFVVNRRYKFILLFVALLVSIFWIGMPGASIESVVYANSVIRDERIVYQIPNLNLSARKALLVAPLEGSWALELALEAGGVRDTIPMYSLQLGEDMLFLPAGIDTLCFTVFPGDTLEIGLIRKFHPFNHPVLHATAVGELL